MKANYSVTIEDFAERHYIKNLKKKYKGAWEVTLRSIIAELERIDMLLETDRAETITSVDEIRIIKTSFRVAQTKESAKTSGNRCIVVANQKLGTVSVLLVYTKTDLPNSNETAEWKKLVVGNYPEMRKYL